MAFKAMLIRRGRRRPNLGEEGEQDKKEKRNRMGKEQEGLGSEDGKGQDR